MLAQSDVHGDSGVPILEVQLPDNEGRLPRKRNAVFSEVGSSDYIEIWKVISLKAAESIFIPCFHHIRRSLGYDGQLSLSERFGITVQPALQNGTIGFYLR